MDTKKTLVVIQKRGSGLKNPGHRAYGKSCETYSISTFRINYYYLPAQFSYISAKKREKCPPYGNEHENLSLSINKNFPDCLIIELHICKNRLSIHIYSHSIMTLLSLPSLLSLLFSYRYTNSLYTRKMKTKLAPRLFYDSYERRGPKMSKMFNAFL